MKILWDGVSFLELTVPPRMAGKMCGLCGNFNGNPEDDLIGKHGAMVPSGQQFGNSWRVGGKKACSVSNFRFSDGINSNFMFIIILNRFSNKFSFIEHAKYKK